MRTNKLLVVIHVVSEEQALRNVGVAFDNGADGVFLISHRGPATMLGQVYHNVRKQFRGRWMGLNFLDLPSWDLVRHLPDDAQALWVDDVGYDEKKPFPGTLAPVSNLRAGLDDKLFHPKLFGGLDFKYRPQMKDLSKAIHVLDPFVDVFTTSGSATGQSPSLEKIKNIREIAGPRKPLAVASGMTPENVEPFLDFVDFFLVATGVSQSFEELDPKRVLLMSLKMRR